MTEQEHCKKCGGAVDLYDDGELHHAVDLDSPEGLFELVAKEHDHPAELCAGACDAFAAANNGRDMHKGPLAQSWEYACDELAELAAQDARA